MTGTAGGLEMLLGAGVAGSTVGGAAVVVAGAGAAGSVEGVGLGVAEDWVARVAGEVSAADGSAAFGGWGAQAPSNTVAATANTENLTQRTPTP